MKKFLFILIALFSFPVFADINFENLLNKVTLQLQAEQWVTTETALVTIAINAAVTDQGIEAVQANVLQKLKKLSDKSAWHIVSFDRQQDKSGLENIQITAQARLPQTELANLRNKAKTISKPGETYTVDNVQFIPSEDELRQAKNILRNNIYQQAKAEIEALNKMYTDQKYYLYQIDFLMQPVAPLPIAQNAMMVGMARSAVAPPLAIGNKVELQATIILAAMPDQIQKLIPHT